MRLDLYQAETAHIAREQSSLLDDARQQLSAGGTLSRLEQNGVLHALQVLIENAIGKTRQILKAKGEPVPVSAYDALNSLARLVHRPGYIDMELVLELVREDQHRFAYRDCR